MKLVSLIALLVICTGAFACQDAPGIQDVVRNPDRYAGKVLEFGDVTLSGTITKYDVSGIRKYYLTVQGRDIVAPGFFLAPPGLADKLGAKMNARDNYPVNLTCKIEPITLNGVEQWHAVVSKVAFLGPDGKVVDTIEVDKK